MIYFITACDSTYFNKWKCLYNSIKQYLNNKSIIYFFDLGLDKEDLVTVRNLDISYQYFDFDKYEDWINIKNDIGQWAWKPQCIKYASDIILDKYKDNIKPYLIWCDSRNLVDNDIKDILKFIDLYGLYTGNSYGDIKLLTHPQTINFFNSNRFSNMNMKNAALIAFNLNINWVIDFINDWAKNSLIKECIFPDGSSRKNHRQDQSVMSILYYIYQEKYHFNNCDFYGGIRIHT